MAQYKKTLRWLEPFGGWNGHTSDTGLCNRIFHWEVAYELNRHNNWEYLILLEEKYWPETKLLDIPDTKTISNVEGDEYDVEKLKFIAIYDTKYQTIDTAKPIYSDDIERMFSTRKMNLKHDHYYCKFNYRELSNLYKFDVLKKTKRPLSEIRLKHRFIEESIQKEVSDAIGIHIRRGNGVPYSQKDLETLPEDIRHDFDLIKRTATIQSHVFYSFHEDKLYFDIMDEILKINPHQNFYISTDMPDNIMYYFYERYKNNIVNKQFLINVVYDYLLTGGAKKSDFQHGNIVENLIDLFSLSYCPFIIKSPTSTWSTFADCYIKKHSVYVTDEWEVIKAKYQKYLKSL
jgi:hypothetical protein